MPAATFAWRPACCLATGISGTGALPISSSVIYRIRFGNGYFNLRLRIGRLTKRGRPQADALSRIVPGIARIFLWVDRRKEVAIKSHFDFPPNTPLNSGDNHRLGCRNTDMVTNRQNGR